MWYPIIPMSCVLEILSGKLSGCSCVIMRDFSSETVLTKTVQLPSNICWYTYIKYCSECSIKLSLEMSHMFWCFLSALLKPGPSCNKGITFWPVVCLEGTFIINSLSSTLRLYEIALVVLNNVAWLIRNVLIIIDRQRNVKESKILFPVLWLQVAQCW